MSAISKAIKTSLIEPYKKIPAGVISFGKKVLLLLVA